MEKLRQHRNPYSTSLSYQIGSINIDNYDYGLKYSDALVGT